MKLVFRPAALRDLQETAGYIETTLGNPAAAKKLKKTVLETCSLLKKQPYMGPALRGRFEELDTELRYFVAAKQLIFYEVQSKQVEVVRILDGRMDYLAILFGENGEQT